jgi:DNA primase
MTGKAGATVDELVEAGLVHPPRGGRTRDRFRDRLVFPIRDERGDVLGFGARALGEAKPKYLNSPDSAAYHKSSAIFGLDLARTAIVREHAAVIVEGYFDVIAAHAAGVEHTVASSGTALTREQVHSLGRIAETLILCFDGDDAGRVAATRAVDVIATEGVQARICRLPAGAKDPDELVRRDPAAFAQAIADAPPAWQVLLDAALGGGEGGSVDARRAAAERAVSVLARIPEATTRELYLQQAARRLDIGARSLSTDLAHSMRDGARRPARIVVAAPAEPAAGAIEEPEPVEADEPMPPWEAQLARVVLIRPELAAALRSDSGLGPDEFTNPTARRIYDAASTDPAGFTLRRLTGGDQRRAAGLLVREVPEFADAAEPEAIRQLMADCVRLIHEESVRRALVSISTEMHRARNEGRTEDADALAAKLSRLAADAPHLRRTVAVR